MSAVRPEPAIEDLRERITGIDLKILALVNERLAVVSELVARKLANGIPLSDGDRESWLLEQLNKANDGGLSASGIEELHRFLLAITRREVIEQAAISGGGR